MTFSPISQRICSILLSGIILLGLSAGFSFPATAQEDSGFFPPMATAEVGDYSLSSNTETHPLIRVTPDKSEIIKLTEDVASVVVGNPAHLSVVLDSPRTLVLVPRAPGSTVFTALGKQGRVIMQRHVVGASPKEKYIRVRKSCAKSGSNDCVETQVFYCPDACHRIETPEKGAGAPLQATVSGSGAAAPSDSADMSVSSSADDADDEEEEEKKASEESADKQTPTKSSGDDEQ